MKNAVPHDPTAPCEMTVSESLAGERLDRALAALAPELGLRGRRRLVECGRALVDGEPAAPGLRLRAGQTLAIAPETLCDVPPLRVIIATAGYAALDKPAGLNSAALAGGGGPSVEARLPALFPNAPARLLNRLDRLTSGVVLVALSDGAARAFARRAPGDVLKEYLAVVEGELTEPLELKRRLDTADRRDTRVLGKLEPEPRGWTLVWPVAALAGGRTLVRVRILAGARHQIRAHLAAASLPIVGDPLYGVPAGGDTSQDEAASANAGGLYLHHRLLAFPGFRAESEPPWLSGLDVVEWYKKAVTDAAADKGEV